MVEAAAIGVPGPDRRRGGEGLRDAPRRLRARRRAPPRDPRPRPHAARTGRRAAGGRVPRRTCRRRGAGRSCAGCCAPGSSGCPRATSRRSKAARPGDERAGARALAAGGRGAAAAHAPDPPLRGALRRALRRGEDPRLPPPLHRRGGGRRRRPRRARARGRRRRHLPRARPRPRPRRARGRGDGRDVREARGHEPRPRRLDAPLRRGPPLLRRERDRGRRAPARRRPRARRPHAGAAAGDGLLLRRGRGRGGRVPRVDEPRRALEAPRALLLREQPLRDGHRPRALGVGDRPRAEGRELRHAGLAGRRHGRARRARRGAPRRARGARRRRARVPRAPNLPLPRALDVRPRALPREERGRGVEGARPDPGLRRAPRGGGRARRRGARRARRRRSRGRSRRPSRSRRPAASSPSADLARFVVSERGGRP